MLTELCRVLKVYPSSLLGVKLSKDELSDIEWKIIQAYREKTDLQKAVNILLGIDIE
jgi:hypothetical protein